MPSTFPTPSHLCRIAEPPQPACGLPVQSKRIRPKASFPHRFPHSSRLGLPAWLLLSKRDRRLIFTLSSLSLSSSGVARRAMNLSYRPDQENQMLFSSNQVEFLVGVTVHPFRLKGR